MNKQLWWLDTILRGVFSVLLLGAVIYLLVAQIRIPDWLIVALNLILGFWFGVSSLRHLSDGLEER